MARTIAELQHLSHRGSNMTAHLRSEHTGRDAQQSTHGDARDGCRTWS